MRTIVVLGAAEGSLSTYRTAAEMGYRTIAVDWSASAPGVELADEYLPLSTRSTPEILAALGGRTDLAGVLAPTSDIALPTLRELTVALGLPVQLSVAAVRASVDKWVVRGMLDELGVSSYRWIEGDDPVQLAKQARELDFPVVVKPADAQSGRGVTRCATPEEVDAAVWEAQRRSYGGHLMIEEEVLGVHCGCECVVDGGKVVFMAMTRRSLSPPPLTMTTAHTMPAGLPDEVENTIRSIVDKLCARLAYRRGPLNLDVVVTPDGEPFVIELGVRNGGNGLDDLVRRCYGVDPVRAAVQAAVGRPIELAPHTPRPVMWRALTAELAGELVSISRAERAAAIPEVVELVVVAEPGQQVRPYLDVSDKLGWVLLRADTIPALDAAAGRVAETLRFEVAPAAEPDAARAVPFTNP
ncbi:MAG: ATP-grasp domain-containing protein [Actinophytocola sp.]|uniref:ATP-grasp domain-containing protein n=1 Tax=Actinophytocola sp. TaxID=1872138 RepID=UPI001329B8E2|nr:ATP-grasp domain-containing protein [Actinophytocola sp.]MPZ82679.1 ATP-grasp domain-containing protein [Actinophytocola sp.]